MAFTCGFFDSVNGDRKYNSRQISQIFDGIIIDGVFAHYGSHFAITPLSGMQINIGDGRFWFKHVWGLNDGNTVVQIDPSDITSNRIDAIVIEIDQSDQVRNAFLKVIKGGIGTGQPALSNSNNLYQYPLAYVTVNAGATSISASNIEVKVGTSECPFATGVLENVNVDNLFSQWDSQFTEWFSGVQAQLEGNVVTNLINQINELRNQSATKQELAEVKAESNIITINDIKYKPIITKIPDTIIGGAYEKSNMKPGSYSSSNTAIDTLNDSICYIGEINSSHIEAFLIPPLSDPISVSVPNSKYGTTSSSEDTEKHNIAFAPNDDRIALMSYRYNTTYGYRRYYIVDFRTKHILNIKSDTIANYTMDLHPIGVYANKLYAVMVNSNSLYIYSIPISGYTISQDIIVSATKLVQKSGTSSGLSFYNIAGYMAVSYKDNGGDGKIRFLKYDPSNNSYTETQGPTNHMAFVYRDNTLSWFSYYKDNTQKIAIYNSVTGVLTIDKYDFQKNYTIGYLGTLPDGTILISAHCYEPDFDGYYAKIYRFNTNGTLISQGSSFKISGSFSYSIGLGMAAFSIEFNTLISTRLFYSGVYKSNIITKIKENLQFEDQSTSLRMLSTDRLYPGVSISSDREYSYLSYINPKCNYILGAFVLKKLSPPGIVSCGYIPA